MSDVKRYASTRLLPDASTWNVSGAAHTYVHISDYAALEAECERLRNQVRGNDIDYDLLGKERDALRAELAALKAPAVAGDERTAFEAWVMQHNTAVREDYDDTDENAPEAIRLDRQGGVYIWANAEAAWFAWKARSALDTRPAQTEQQQSAAQQILDLILDQCRYWQGRDEARRGGFACLYAQAKEIVDAAPIAQTPADGLVEALEHARLFIRNGVALGYIQMPDVDTPDPAHDTLPKIDAALAAHRAGGRNAKP